MLFARMSPVVVLDKRAEDRGQLIRGNSVACIGHVCEH